jgi:hypothetical protein
MHFNESVIATRRSVHAICEHILAGVRHGDRGKIGLRCSDGRVHTGPLSDGSTVGVVGDELFRSGADGEKRAPITTLRDAGRFAGIEPGVPGRLWEPITTFDLDGALSVNAAAFAELVAWFDLVIAALESLQESDPEADWAAVTLWPEHFDLATSARSVNVGGSGGDAYHELPYAYVGPFDRSGLADDDRWNAPFGSFRPATDVDAASLVMYFADDYRHAAR